MARFTVTGPIGPKAISYNMVPGSDPLDALLTAHRDGPGPGRVRLVRSQLLFSDPRDHELSAGGWRVTSCTRQRENARPECYR
jgi:hypothetical protein